MLIVPWVCNAQATNNLLLQQETTPDSLKFPFKDQESVIDLNKKDSPLFLKNPSNIKDTTIYDPNSNEYIISKKIGSFDYRPSQRMTFDEYKDYQFEQSLRNYWRQKARAGDAMAQSGLLPGLRL